MARRKSILFAINEDWFFLSHFQAFAETAAGSGLDVVIMANSGPATKELEARGWRVIPLAARRGSLSPIGLARQIVAATRVLRRERPDIVHAISLPSILGCGPAALLAGVPSVVLAPTGLGHLWIAQGSFVRMVRAGVRAALAALFRSPRVTALFENDEDPLVFGLDPSDARKVVLIGGAGVDVQRFAHEGLAFRHVYHEPGEFQIVNIDD